MTNGLKTINDVKKTSKILDLEIKIFNIEKRMEVSVIKDESFDYDF